MNFNEKMGDVIEKTKYTEYYLNCIIGNYIAPKKAGFFDNVILNSSIVSFGSKLKIIKTICETEKMKFNFQGLHTLINLRNLFAHESSYVDEPEKGMLLRIDELKSNGEYVQSVFDDKYNEFLKIYKEEIDKIIKLNQDLTEKKCHHQ